MKRAASIMSICLIVILAGASASLAMGRVRNTDKLPCGCAAGECKCAKADAAEKLPCGCAVGECKCAKTDAAEKLPCGCPVGQCKCAPEKK